MKKVIAVILFLGALCAFLFQKYNEENVERSHIYEVLSREQFGPYDEDKQLYIIIGIDYIPHELVEIFEEITGIKVVVDIFDSNEILEAKLLAGGAKYDIVFPTAWPNFSRQLKAGIYQELDKNRLDMTMFDADILDRLAEYDAHNRHAVPFQFGISGIGVNDKIIRQLLGDDVPRDTYALLFDPKNAEKLSKYRISLYESPDEMFPAVLAYLGMNPETENEEDIIKAADHLKKIRPYVSKFTSFGFEDLASSNACIALATSGDVLKVQYDNKNPDIKFYCPKEGASLWIDVAAVPLKARHINNIYAFFKFLFHPIVIAEVTNVTSRANAVVKATKYVNSDLSGNPDIYPSTAVRKKCYIEKPVPSHIESLKTRLLTKIKSMDSD
ncbi:MAG: extracellular solute-binding protein [Holosporaceae bacterium]|jgi:putrescine transport system substrate-binding protein|nr:extracellular solute-binding protein [Holosporaceae bacterium]